MIKYPKSNHGQVIDDLVSLTDIMPTILGVTGTPVPDDVQGSSLLNLPSGTSRVAFSESFQQGVYRHLHERFDRIQRAVYSGSLKFISSTSGRKELYDLSRDPDETQGLYGQDDASSQMQRDLNRWLVTVQPKTSQPVEMDPATGRTLKALGYIR